MRDTVSQHTPAPGPIDKILRDFDLPNWLSIIAVVTVLVVFYKPLGELLATLWRAGARGTASLRSASKRARRRKLFADHLESAMRRLAEKEEWRDSRFAELEAEVELERESPPERWRRRFGASRGTRVRRVPSLTSALKKSSQRLIVLEGDPGGGKSVALRHLAQSMALRASRRPSERSVLPIYVNLKTFRPPANRRVSAEDVREFVLESLNPAQSRDIDRFLRDEFDTGLEEGLWLCLFDSFDEIPAVLGASEAESNIEEYSDAISGFIGMGSSRGIIASREFRGPRAMGWPRFRVMPLTRKRRAALIKRADLDDEAENMLLHDLGAMELDVQQLADNPLFLSLLCEYVRDERSMPESTHAVMETYVRSRLSRDRERIESRFAVAIDATRAFAEEMAFQMLSTPELGLSASRTRIIERVGQRLGQSADEGGAAIDALIYSKLARYSDDEVHRSPEDAPVTFSHRRLQEYFATCIVINEPSRIGPTELLTNGRWRETAVAVLQTRRPEDTIELLTQAEEVLRERTAAGRNGDSPDGTPGRIWRPGVLHVLDLLANGLKPDQSGQHPVSGMANEILDHAWEHGNRLDRKWVVELCAAAGTERAIGYLKRAFDSESLWLRDHAYAQVRRLGPAASRLESQIRQMLLDMSVGGTLRRNRKTVRAQLQRLAAPGPLQRAVSLILAAPVVGATGGLIAAGLLLWITSFPSTTAGACVSAITVACMPVVAVFCTRFALASNGRAHRYARGGLAWFGLDAVAIKDDMAPILSMSSLWMGLLLVGWAVLGEDFKTILGLGGTSVLATVAVLGVVVWLVGWSHAALFVMSELFLVSDGAWMGHRFAPGLPLHVVRWYIRISRRMNKDVSRRRRLANAIWILVGIVVVVYWLYDESFPDWMLIIILFCVGLTVLSMALVTVIGSQILITRMWQRHLDDTTVSHLIQADGELNTADEVLHALHGLHTDAGVQQLLRDVRKRVLQRQPEIADLLAFLSLCLEQPKEPEQSGEAPSATAQLRGDWAEWWMEYRRRSGAAPLLAPSSETLDELGRVLEDAHRTAAFHT